MLNIKKLVIGLIAILFVAVGCSKKVDEKTENYLASWNEGSAKTSIIKFVEDVTDQNSPNYVKPEDRIATFDNDGTLWSEQPIYFQFAFALDRVKSMAEEHPEWKKEQPFKAVLENNKKALAEAGEEGLIKILVATHSGTTSIEFAQIVKDWVATAKHPILNRPYTDLIYQPMLEVLEYLRANEFKTFIVSGGGLGFMRPLTEVLYGIPAEQVVGSSFKTKFEIQNGKEVILRLPEVEFNNDKAGKPVAINKFIGKKPIAAFGNSDGDLQMLQWTSSNDKPNFMLYVHHTDSVREWAYDRESHIGKLDKGLDEANKKGWTVVDMKNDWKVIYPFEL